MSFWMGFNEAWEKDKDRKLKETLLDKQLLEKKKDRLYSLVGSRLEKTKKRETPAAKVNIARQRLEKYGVSSEVIDRMEATGDYEGMTNVVNDLEGAFTGYKQEGRPVPKDLVSSYIEGVVMSPASVQELDLGVLDFSDFNELGLSQEEIDAISYETVPGAISAEPPVVVEQPSLEDLTKIEERVVSAAKQRASEELRNLNSFTANLNKELESLPEGEEKEQQKSLLVTALERQRTVREAINGSTGDNPSVAPLISLYGAQSFNSILESRPQFKGQPFGPVFEEYAGTSVPRVANMDEASVLYKIGVLKEGDLFYNRETGMYHPIEIQD